MLRRYRSAGDLFLELFGEKTYKLSLTCGNTCPNRDGTKGTGGCIFCGEAGSGEFSVPCTDASDIGTAIERAKALVSSKTKAGRFIAYFQGFTATYMPADKLEPLLSAAADRGDISAISVATRPDCLPDDIVGVLRRTAERKPLFVELGLQTARDDTAKLINRGYPLSVYDDAAGRLREAGANVITHMILGLPGECKEDGIRTAEHIGKTADGIKIQSLFILAGTKLADMYEKGEYRPLSKEDYIDMLCECVEILPPDTVIHRITGDPPKKLMLAPEWAADKKRVLADIDKAFTARDVRQGAKADKI